MRLSCALCAALVLAGAGPATADGKRVAAGKVKVTQDGKLKLPGPVLFQVGSDQLAPASEDVLERVKSYLDEHKKVTKLRVEVHTDARGSSGYNLAVSKRRAMTVAYWLVDKGVACERLVPVGFGESKPLVSPERTAEDRAKNRRVDFFVAARKGKKAKKNKPIDGGGHIAGDPCK